MEHLIGQGVPMRAAHEAVGKLVRLCEERRCRLADLPAEVYENVHPGLSAGVAPQVPHCGGVATL